MPAGLIAGKASSHRGRNPGDTGTSVLALRQPVVMQRPRRRGNRHYPLTVQGHVQIRRQLEFILLGPPGNHLQRLRYRRHKRRRCR